MSSTLFGQVSFQFHPAPFWTKHDFPAKKHCDLCLEQIRARKPKRVHYLAVKLLFFKPVTKSDSEQSSVTRVKCAGCEKRPFVDTFKVRNEKLGQFCQINASCKWSHFGRSLWPVEKLTKREVASVKRDQCVTWRARQFSHWAYYDPAGFS